VLIEKPITLKLNEAEHLNKVAKKKKKVLMVGHTFLYNQSVLKLRELIKKKIAGKIYYINCRRTHLGLIRKDVNVIWDLAPHDISIVNFILKKEPLNLKVSTSQFLKKGRSDVAFLNFIYPKNILTNIHLSWLDSNKCRTIEIIGSKARILFDDLNLLEPIKIYKKKLLKKKNDQNYHLRDGNILSPQIKIKEPLFEMCKDFIKSIKYKTKPVSDFKVGYACIKALKLSNTFN
jgi:predicted dehydrogenase